jgi:hypothetical protein
VFRRDLPASRGRGQSGSRSPHREFSGRLWSAGELLDAGTGDAAMLAGTTTERRRAARCVYKAVAVLVALATVAVGLVVAMPASAAGNAGTTQVSTFDPTGQVFTCPRTDYTILGGTVRSVFHDSFAANGSEHVTGTTALLIGVELDTGASPQRRSSTPPCSSSVVYGLTAD